MRALLKKTATVTARVDLHGLIEDALALVQGELRRHRIVLRTELAEDLPPVAGDRVQLQQVMLNLVMNGIEAMNEVAERPRELLIISRPEASEGDAGRRERCRHRARPTECGAGVRAVLHDESGGPRHGPGHLPVYHRTHGGRLWASANEPRGAVFQFTLPSTQDELAPAEDVGSVPVA